MSTSKPGKHTMFLRFWSEICFKKKVLEKSARSKKCSVFFFCIKTWFEHIFLAHWVVQDHFGVLKKTHPYGTRAFPAIGGWWVYLKFGSKYVRTYFDPSSSKTNSKGVSFSLLDFDDRPFATCIKRLDSPCSRGFPHASLVVSAWF